jgi:hypothetical protein
MTQGLSTGPNRGKDMPWPRETLMRREREASILLDPAQETVQQRHSMLLSLQVDPRLQGGCRWDKCMSASP